MSNIFDEAKFGDKFKTRDGRIAIFYSVCEEDDGYNFIIEPSENSVETIGIDFHFVDKNGHWHRRDDVDTENDIVENKKIHTLQEEYHHEIKCKKSVPGRCFPRRERSCQRHRNSGF